MVEAGWYHVDGDPAGTVRRWNGHEWIGFPIPDPTGASGAASGVHNAHNTSHKHSRLTQRGRLLSVVSMVSLTLLAVLFVLAGRRVLGDASNIASAGTRNATVRVSDLGVYIEGLERWATIILLAIVVTGVVFIMWLRAAATAAQVKTLKRVAHRAQRSRFSAIVQVLYFGLLAPIFWGIRAALSGVSASRPDLFGLVSDTAMAASIDPKTGVSTIEPMKILVWWALWWIPALVSAVAWGWIWLTGPPTTNELQSVVQLSGALLLVEALSLLFIIITVGQITWKLGR